MNSTPIVLACAADDNYAMPMGVMLFSALVNMEKGAEVVLYILDGGISEANRRKIERVLAVERIKVSLHWAKPSMLEFQDLQVGSGLPQAAYLRLALPDILPEHFAKVLYLDSDLIVEANLIELWRHETAGYALWAVRDYPIPYVSSPNSPLLETHGALGLEPDTPYFNSGVMLLHMGMWRSENLGPAALEYLRVHCDTVQYADQDCLNAIVAGNWGELDLRWNVTVHALPVLEGWPDSPFKNEMRDNRKWLGHNAFVLHFAGNLKPWHIGMRTTYCQRWVHYLKRSGWFSPAEYRRWYIRWLVNLPIGCITRFCHFEIRSAIQNRIVRETFRRTIDTV